MLILISLLNPSLEPTLYSATIESKSASARSSCFRPAECRRSTQRSRGRLMNFLHFYEIEEKLHFNHQSTAFQKNKQPILTVDCKIRIHNISLCILINHTNLVKICLVNTDNLLPSC